MITIEFNDGSTISVRLDGGDVGLELQDVDDGEPDMWLMSAEKARLLAVGLAAVARLVDPESAERARLLAEAEADVDAALKARG